MRSGLLTNRTNNNRDCMVHDIKASIQTCSFCGASSISHLLANAQFRDCEVHDIKASSQTCPVHISVPVVLPSLCAVEMTKASKDVVVDRCLP